MFTDAGQTDGREDRATQLLICDKLSLAIWATPSAIWGFHDWDSTHLAKLQGNADQVQDGQQQAFHHSDGPRADLHSPPVT